MAKKTLNFGSNMLIQVEMIRDFFPFWVDPLWSRELVERDLKILRSLGGRRIRFHILPASYEKDGYVGDAASAYRELVPFALATARGLGLKTHLDIHTDNFTHLETKDVLERLCEFGPENIDTLQVVNEYFYLWNHDANLEKIELIFDAIRKTGYAGELCFDAGGSVHRKIARQRPSLAKYFNMIPLHHYPPTLEWDRFTADLFVEFLGGKRRMDLSSLSPERRAHYHGVMREHFGGLKRELRLLEIHMAGHHFWGGTAPGARGKLWPEMMRRIAEETRVSTVATWCLRGKMSWREFGHSQCGMLYPCEMPRPEADVFRKTAMDLMPATDVFAAFDVTIEASGASAEIRVANKTPRAARGKLVLPTGMARTIRLAPRGQSVARIPLKAFGKMSSGVVHLFAEFVHASAGKLEGRCIGWKAVLSPRPIKLARKTRFSMPDVKYPDGLAPLTDFIGKNRERLAIIVEQPAGPETELAMRLQSAMAEAWGIMPPIGSLMLGAADLVRDHALIILGVSGQNSLIRLLECLLERRYLPGASPTVKISAHPGLFQRRPVRPIWATSSVQKSFGDACFSPGVIAGIASSFAPLRAGVYDLIQRMLAPGPSAMAYTAANHPEARSGFPLARARRFAVNLGPGRYLVRFTAGTAMCAEHFATRIRLSKPRFSTVLETRKGIKWAEAKVDHPGGALECEFGPAQKGPACMAAMRVFNQATGAVIFSCYFSRDIRVVLDYEGYYRVADNTRLGVAAVAKNWQEMRAEGNETVHRELAYGWTR